MSEDPSPAPPTGGERLVSQGKEMVAFVAVAGALVYGAGFLARTIAMRGLRVGDVSIARESAVLTGFVLFLLFGVASLPFAYLWLTGKGKPHKRSHFNLSLWFATSYGGLWMTDSLIVLPNDALPVSPAVLLTVSVVTITWLVALAVSELVEKYREYGAEGAYRIPMTVFMFALAASLAGSQALGFIEPSFGGFAGPDVDITVAGRSGTLRCQYVCEDPAWVVVRVDARPGHGHCMRFAKSDVRLIEQVDAPNKPAAPSKSTGGSK